MLKQIVKSLKKDGALESTTHKHTKMCAVIKNKVQICFNCILHHAQAHKDVRSELIPGSPLVKRSKIVFPPLHIKLGILKQFVKALEKDGDYFKYIFMKFAGLSIEKLKAGVFDETQI